MILNTQITTNMTKLILILVLEVLLLATVTSAEDAGEFARTMNKKQLSLQKKEKLTYLRFYWHDSVKGRNPSATRIKEPVSNSTMFGSMTMMDDALTTDVSRNSSVVGQAQGFYAGAAQGEISYLVVMNFAFKTGKYNGSTLAVFGRDPVISSKVREMPIVGGSGIFRLARGYVEARTNLSDVKAGKAIVQYSCYVLHY
ncbi:hypothetical protein EUTSA_v10008817mg [Eutrema salsugineum]|uniref:Dirigent protein n=1 Tax=Eutrema salsugineum TaxID=72664 RepID=V4KQJ2_EUTSA|nr:dirigent protein 22 [Eutrema salsugineum]ESQ33534.1 hypothetical protein EUTSA_v10008817mg [Eutrema salsugineum]